MKVFRNTLLVAASTIALLAMGATPAATASPPTAATATITPNTIQYVAKGFAGPAAGGMITGTVHCPPGTFVVSVSGQTPILGSIGPISPISPSPQAPPNHHGRPTSPQLWSPGTPQPRRACGSWPAACRRPK